MSLKAFHIVFIVVSILTTFGFAVWACLEYAQHGQLAYLLYGIGAAIAGVALVCYGKYVLRKLKDMPYL